MNFPIPVQENKNLSEYCTFRIGGPARYFISIDSIEVMQKLICYCFQNKVPYFILGKGSNCLFNDKGFDGLVILNKISFCEYQDSAVFVGAGYSFSLLGTQTARRGLSGLEFASGIPGSVGGAIYMNAGANSQETKDVLDEVLFLDEDGTLSSLKKDKIVFSYRFSSFQHKKAVILAGRFLLTSYAEARKKQMSIIDYRTRTQPYGDASAGCVFRNPPQQSAGALIEKCGLKGRRIGGAEVSLMHANFIVNKEQATSQDVIQLARLVQKCVKEQTGIDLEMEVRCIPYQT